MPLREFAFEQFHHELRAVRIGIPGVVLGDINHTLVEIVESIERPDSLLIGFAVAAEQVADQQEFIVDADGPAKVRDRLAVPKRLRGAGQSYRPASARRG